MNKRDYLEELKAHNWSWGFGSGNSILKGRLKERELTALAAEQPELQELFDAYQAFKFGKGPEPRVHESKPCTRYNLQTIMFDAWYIARSAAKRLGGRPSHYFPCALKQAWAREKARKVGVARSVSTPKTVYFLCIDEALTRNTKIINQPAVDAFYTCKEDAESALFILNQAFSRPFIKSSSLYHPYH